MIESKRHNYRLIAIAIATLAAGLMVWTQNSRQIDFTDLSFLFLWLLTGTIASFVSQFIVNLRMGDIIGSFSIGYVIAIVIHFVSGVFGSNYVQTRFELFLLIALIIGSASGWLGALIWSLLRKSGRKKK
jgi:uncharacterized membrane protein YeaQ/YmgE (transglycosylase-associated protein family)